jgi:hypothetical protein
MTKKTIHKRKRQEITVIPITKRIRVNNNNNNNDDTKEDLIKQLPCDTLQMIFCHFEEKSKCGLRRVCHDWNYVINHLVQPKLYEVYYGITLDYFCEQGTQLCDGNEGKSVRGERFSVLAYHEDHVAYDIFCRYDTYYRALFSFESDIDSRICNRWAQLNGKSIIRSEWDDDYDYDEYNLSEQSLTDDTDYRPSSWLNEIKYAVCPDEENMYRTLLEIHPLKKPVQANGIQPYNQQDPYAIVSNYFVNTSAEN